MQEKYESRRGHHQHLTRPDGSPLSEKDSLLLDLCIQWTKDNKIATSTYEYLLEEKFPRQSHPITVKRTLNNISLYIKSEFKNLQVIDGKKVRNKIHIERVEDFDLKMATAIELLEEKQESEVIQKCRPHRTKMLTPDDKNVDPLYIDKNTNKKTIDNYDHKNDLSINHCSSVLKKKEEETNTENTNTETRIEKQSVSYWGIPLKEYKYTNAMLEEVRLASNKPEFSQERIAELFEYLADKYADKMIYGGRKGFVSYMTKVVNGEKTAEQKQQEKQSRIEEGYLAKLESSYQTTPEWRFKKKLASALQRSKAYKLLTSIRFINLHHSGNLRITLSKDVELSVMDKQIILQQARASYNSQDKSVETLELRADNNSLSKQSHESQELPPTVWGGIRKSLQQIYGDKLENAWFGKMGVVINEEKKELSLQAPSEFFKDWIENNYQQSLEAIVQKQGYVLSGITI